MVWQEGRGKVSLKKDGTRGLLQDDGTVWYPNCGSDYMTIYICYNMYVKIQRTIPKKGQFYCTVTFKNPTTNSYARNIIDQKCFLKE